MSERTRGEGEEGRGGRRGAESVLAQCCQALIPGFDPAAGDQPRLIQGIRRRDGIGEGQETTA